MAAHGEASTHQFLNYVSPRQWRQSPSPKEISEIIPYSNSFVARDLRESQSRHLSARTIRQQPNRIYTAMRTNKRQYIYSGIDCLSAIKSANNNRQVSSHGSCVLSIFRISLNLIEKRIDRLVRKEIFLAPFGVIESVTIEKHDKPLHLDTSNLFSKNRKALALQFAICHSYHANTSFRRIRLGLRRALPSLVLPC